MSRMSLLVALAGVTALSANAQTATVPPGAPDSIGPAPITFFAPPPALPTADLNALLTAQVPVYTIQPDDVLTVSVYGVHDFSLKPRVTENGMIHLPLIGNLKLAGLTVSQAEDAVDGVLISQDLIKTPGTTIESVERPGQTVTVSGDVAKPGIFPASGRHNLSEFIALAGGLRDTASTTLTLRRPRMVDPVAIPLGADALHSPFRSVPIFAGDEIHVSGVGVMYVVGALKNQGAFPLKSTTPTTVLQAITLAGGMGYEASADSSQLLRTQGNQRIMMPVKVGRIIKGKDPDIALRNDDILYIPTEKAKAAIKGGATGLIVSLASTYIYAHP